MQKSEYKALDSCLKHIRKKERSLSYIYYGVRKAPSLVL